MRPFFAPSVTACTAAGSGLLLVCLVVPRAYAQTPPPEKLTLSASTAAGYDANALGEAAPGVVSPGVAPNGGYTANNVSLEYSKTGGLSIAADATSDYRLYQTTRKLTTYDFGGGLTLSGDLAPKLRAGASVNAIRSSQYVFWPFPTLGNTGPVAVLSPEPFRPPSLDYSVPGIKVTNYGTSAVVAYSPTKRATFSAQYGFQRSNTSNINYNYSGQIGDGHFTYGLTRYASLRLGYTTFIAQYATRPHALTNRTIDAGVAYSRPLSFSRRTKFAFSASSLGVDDGQNRYNTVGGSATLSYEISRLWSASGSVDRGISLVNGFGDLFLSNGGSALLKGGFGRRTTVRASTGYSRGNIAIARGPFQDFRSRSASARVDVNLARRWSVFSEYFYYKYHFSRLVALPVGQPYVQDRNGVRVGLVLTLPLLNERTTRATR